MAHTQFSNEILEKSLLDSRLYRYIVLSNGLCALLVHDPEGNEDKAAAALSIGIGSLAEPKEAGGLAHLLEHMVFKGSKKFPNELEFIRYIKERGGEVNAETSDEHTCFYFDVKRDFLRDALERFAEIIFSPLLRDGSVQREVSIMNEEFMLTFQDDNSRLEQLKLHTCLPNHPYNRFTWGNEKSLSLDYALLNDMPLHERLSRFHCDSYHIEVMKLVLMGTSSLDTLQEWVEAIFGNIDGGGVLKPECPMLPIWSFGKIFKLKAMSQHCEQLELSWSLPSLRDKYQKKADLYIAYLIEYDGEGGLFSLLNARGWVHSISSSFDEKKTLSTIVVFGITLELSMAGSKKVLDVIDLLYQYLKVLRSGEPQKWVFKELQDRSKSDFLCYKPNFEIADAEDLVGKLWLYPSHHILYGEYAYDEWDPAFIQTYLRLLKTENMRVDVISKCFDERFDFGSKIGKKSIKRKRRPHIEIEPWYQSEYSKEDIPLELMELWDDPPKVDPHLKFPSKRNITKPYLFACLNQFCSGDEFGDVQPHQSINFDYNFDGTRALSHVSLSLNITLCRAPHSLKNIVLMKIFLKLLNEELTETVAEAHVGGLEVSFRSSHDTLNLEIHGLISKVHVFLSRALPIMTSLQPTDSRFKAVVEEILRKIYPEKTELESQCDKLMEEVLYKNSWSIEEALKMLRNVSFSLLKRFITHLFSKVYVEANCQGNISGENAHQIHVLLRNTFTRELLPVEERYKQAALRLPPKANYIIYRIAEEPQVNSLVNLHFQIGENTMTQYAMAKLFAKLVRPMLEDAFRLEEQLCYTPTCEPWLNLGILGFDFRIQSFRSNPEYLLRKIEYFISDIKIMLDGVDEDKFERYKDVVRDELVATDTSNYYASEDEDADDDISIRFKEKTANSLSKTDLMKWYEKYFWTGNPSLWCKRIAFSIWRWEPGTITIGEHDDRQAFPRMSAKAPALTPDTAAASCLLVQLVLHQNVLLLQKRRVLIKTRVLEVEPINSSGQRDVLMILHCWSKCVFAFWIVISSSAQYVLDNIRYELENNLVISLS